MSALTKLWAGLIAATLAAAAATAAPVMPASDVDIKVTNNIREAVGIMDVELAIVIDKNNRIHVLTVRDIKHPAESEAESTKDDDTAEKDAGGGNFSTRIRQEADGCWWLTRGERNQDGALIEADEVCIGGRGCPVGERRPVA